MSEPQGPYPDSRPLRERTMNIAAGIAVLLCALYLVFIQMDMMKWAIVSIFAALAPMFMAMWQISQTTTVN